VWQPYDLVFSTRTGGPLQPRNVVRQFKRMLRAAGLPQAVRLYDMRHTTATLMIAAGLSPKIVAERLGHSTVKLTLDTYTHVSEGMQQQATAVLEALVYGRPPESGQG
jgi:integrase